MADTHKILIADGKPKTIPESVAAFRELGYETIAAGDASFVLTMALRHRPGVVVLGAQLAAGGAVTALRRLRSSVHTASIPVIALADPGPQKQALLSAGAEVCLAPPVDVDDLVAAIQQCLGTARAVAEAPAAILRDPDRLQALGATGLLDSDPDEATDVLTRLAAEVLGVPVALVSLVDDRRQFFKSQVGLPAPWDERRQTPLSHSFCQWVVSSQEELVINDARAHPVLRSNGAVVELGVIAYAGVPLSALMGQPIGSFCAIDVKPREWSADELATLRDFAQLVDAQAILGQSETPGGRSAADEGHVRAVARAAGRGFLGAARLLRRDRPRLTDQQRRDLLSVIERHSYQLTDAAADAPAIAAVPDVA